MSLLLVPQGTYEIQPPVDLTQRPSDAARTLIVCETNSDARRLETILREAGLDSESIDSMTAACEPATSGRFGVVFSTPFAGEG